MTESKFKKINEDVKTFKDLEDDVIKTNLCCACGACIAHCESQSFDVIEMENYSPKFKSEKNAENCTECGVCYFICPQTSTLLDKLNQAYCVEDEIGQVLEILAAKTTNKAIGNVGQDGGIVSTILTYLFDEHMIDAAIVSECDENFEPIPKIVYDKNDLLKSAGTRYSLSSQILPLKELYNLSEEILEKMGVHEVDQLRLAFVGTPCQCRALSKMKLLNIKPAHVIKYIIGLFCFENFNYSQLYEIIKKETNVPPTDIKKTWIKKNFFIKTKEDKEFELDIKTLDPAVRNHCHECDEFTARFTDISVGASGAPKGYSMIIMRTENGVNIIKELISRGMVEQLIVDQVSEWNTKKINWFKKLLSFKTKK